MDVELDQEYLDSVVPEVIRRAPEEPMLFLDSLVIPSASGPKRFNKVMEPFQREAFEVLMPSLQAVCRWEMPAIRRFWFERTKKASKDSDLAAAILWVIAFCSRPVKIQIVASHYKQASIIENRAVELLHYNPWLKPFVEIVEGKIRRPDRPKEIWAHIEATNTGREAHGETPDILVLNELVHVAKWEVMETHMNNADGVPQGVVVVATNAGIKGTPAWKWREEYRRKKRWWMQFWSKKAPWVSDEDVEEARLRDPVGSEFTRLWKGRWISGMGDALDDDEIEAIFVKKGPLRKPQRGWIYFAGLDLGVSKDHAAVVVVGVNKKTLKVRIARMYGFAPELPVGDKHEVDEARVFGCALKMGKLFRVVWFGYDPASGGSFMAQRLRKKGLRMEEVKFVMAKVQTEMATALVQLVKHRYLLAYDDKEGRLRRDLGKFSIEHKPPKSYKLIAVHDEYGHADVGIALALTLPRIIVEMGGWEVLQPTDTVAMVGDGQELTEEEREDMPKELKELVEMEEGMAEESYLKNRRNVI